MPEYTLNINIDGGSDGNKAKAKAALNTVNNKNNTADNAKAVANMKSEGGKAAEGKSKLNSTASKVGAGAAAAGLVVLHSAHTVAKYKLSHYGSKYSYTARQNQINNVMKTVGDIAAVGSKIAATTAAGAVAGGPIGAAIGAVAGTIMSVFDLSYEMYERNQEWVRQNHEYEIQQSRASERLGLLASDRNRGR